MMYSNSISAKTSKDKFSFSGETRFLSRVGGGKLNDETHLDSHAPGVVGLQDYLNQNMFSGESKDDDLIPKQ